MPTPSRPVTWRCICHNWHTTNIPGSNTYCSQLDFTAGRSGLDTLENPTAFDHTNSQQVTSGKSAANICLGKAAHLRGAHKFVNILMSSISCK